MPAQPQQPPNPNGTSLQLNPAVFARIAPDVFFQRHLKYLETRPFSTQKFEEFRPLHVSRGTLAGPPGILGSAVAKCGATSVICSVTAGIEEVDPLKYDTVQDFGSLSDEFPRFRCFFPTVEVERGRAGGPPTDEEMALSQALCEFVGSCGIVKEQSVEVIVGRKLLRDGELTVEYSEEKIEAYCRGESIYTEEFRDFELKKQFRYVLYANVQVIGRAGPPFGLICAAVGAALSDTRLPLCYLPDDVRSLDRNGDKWTVLCDGKRRVPLQLHGEFPAVSEFGVAQIEGKFLLEDEAPPVETVFLADLNGEAEEAAVSSRITVAATAGGVLKYFSLISGDADITREDIRKAVRMAQQRAEEIQEK